MLFFFAKMSAKESTLTYAGRPTMTITILSEALTPITSSGVAFSPSGMTCGIGL